MANVNDTLGFVPVYQWEVTDKVLGGASGPAVLPIKQLASRDKYINDKLTAALANGTGFGDFSLPFTKIADGARAAVFRNTMILGSYDNTTGLPDVLSGNSSSVVFNLSGAEVLASFSDGLDSHGHQIEIPMYGASGVVLNKDLAGKASATYYVYLNLSGSTVTLDVSDFEPVYDSLAPSAPSTDQHWFDLNRFQMFRWSGSAWVAVKRVFVGRIFFNGTAVSSPNTYPYRQDYTYSMKLPAGIINPFAGSSPKVPAGWLLCDGTAIDRKRYARLFQVLSTAFGAGDGTTTFNLPDLRGEFIRGFDEGRGVDIDQIIITGTRTNGSPTLTVLEDTSGLSIGMSISGTGIPGGTTITAIPSATTVTMSANATSTGTRTSFTFSKGRVFGSNQADMFKSHYHIMKKYNLTIGAGAGFFAMDDQGTDGSENTVQQGGSETRPRNVAMNFIIKY